jgi:hypothetical protein
MDDVLFDETVAVILKSPERDSSVKQGKVCVHVTTKTIASPAHRNV